MTWWRRADAAPAAPAVSYWTATGEPGWGRTPETLAAVSALWTAYGARDLDMAVTPVDDMFVDSEHGRAHYRWVGVSALDLVTDAMVLSGRTSFGRVLDLPCGGGRVTRHLVAFLPEAEIFVDDIDASKKTAVLAQFPVASFTAPRDFVAVPAVPGAPGPGMFDLIFVGSLFTHLDAPVFAAALDYLIGTLAPGGILILTAHGRYSATSGRWSEHHKGLTRQPPVPRRWFDRSPPAPVIDDALEAIEGGFAQTGFGYTEYRSYTEAYGQSYGGSFSAPSWVMRHVESREDAMILGYKERAFANHQDVVTIQKIA